MPERDLVFFSYNHDDDRWLTPIRAALEPYVLDEKLNVWSDRQIEVGNRWDTEIQDALARTRVAVLLISQRFFASTYIRRKELPRLIEDAEQGLLTLVCVPVGDVDPELLRDCRLSSYQFSVDPSEPLSARRGRQREKAVVEISMRVKEAYRRPETEAARAHAPDAIGYRDAPRIKLITEDASGRREGQTPGPLFGVPDLDQRRYIERTDALTRLKQLALLGTNLAAGVTSARLSGRVGVHGMGGMGKTVLAQAFCHDPDVRRAFTHGIYWLTLGQDPALLAEQTRLLKMIDDRVPVVESSAQARELLKERLAQKRVLLVIDDLWREEHFRAFDVAGDESRVLVTTRDAGLLTLIGAREEALDRMDERQAQTLIAEWAGLEVGGMPPAARRVAELCGYLPLALSLAGAQIADGVQWATLVEQLERGKVEFLDHDYGSVFDSLGRSVDALSERERTRYLELAAFPEDARIPPRTVAQLWRHSGGVSEADTEKLLGRFHRKALLRRVQVGSSTHICLHDLQHDFARIRADSPRVLSARLLDAYRATLGLPSDATGWSELPADEPYLWTSLASHLVEAGREAELEALLLSVRWIRAKLKASTTIHAGRPSADVNALLSDYDCLGDLPDVSLVQRALRMSSHVIGPNPEQAGLQLFGRLGTSDAPALKRLCTEAIDQAERPGLVPAWPALSPPGALVLTLAGHERRINGAAPLADGRRALSWARDGTLKMWDLERGVALHTLVGHEGGVDGATLFTDGRRALSWARDRTLKVWDLERGEALHTLVGHELGVNGTTLLADSRRALSWSIDGTLKVWDLERGEALHALAAHGGGVNGATLSPDGRRALSWSGGQTFKVWDLERGEAVCAFVNDEAYVNGATLLADGRRALSWAQDGTLKVWDLERGEALHTLAGHEGGVDGATLIADGRRALSWARDRTLKVWDLERGEALHTLAGHENQVNGATLLADGRRALSWSRDRTLKVWDLERGEALHTLAGHEGEVYGATLLADGRRALSWSRDRTLKVWDLERGEALRTLAGHEGRVNGATLLADGRRALSWANDRTLRVWDLLEHGEALHTPAGHESDVYGATLLADGRRTLSWSADGTLKVWDLERGEALHTLAGHEDWVNGATLLADGRRALSWSADGTLKVWDLERIEALHTLAGHEGEVYGATLLADGRRALSWSGYGTLRVWDLERGEALHTLAGHKGGIYGATLLADGRRVLSWSGYGTLRVWDLERGEALHTLAGHEGGIYGATLLADGRRALSCSGDRTLKMWDLERGEALYTLAGHKDRVNGATLLADGRRALSWSVDCTLKVWDLERGKALHTLAGHENQINGATLLADGRRALSWSADCTLKVWDLERGVALHTLAGHGGAVYGAKLLRDGRRALSWSNDRTLRLWDIEHGVPISSYFADAVLCEPAVDESRGRIFCGDSFGRIHIICVAVEGKRSSAPYRG